MAVLLKCLIQFIGKMRQEDIYIGWIPRNFYEYYS